ncbi:melanopsin [Notechis scutatus]|uniref:Melanopsin n=1 Tax=Notechis scutatus TaxID=8663 RepID=A0A6J1UBU5_9SAUR|nr:melanopsin [Notechis scutatus]
MEERYRQNHTTASGHPTKVDVPDHVLYTVGSCVLAIGCVGIMGNLLVLYAFYSNKRLRTPANYFIMNLAASDFLMSATQAPVCFFNSMHKEWVLGDTGCNFYAFCGALFGITSMMTLLAISVDRYCVITKPLQSLKRSTKKRSYIIIMFVWLYSLGWSVCPLFGWSSYIPEGLMISCTWDYVSYSPSNRSYTMLLCWCVFFIPLMIIFHCYLFMFLTIRSTGRNVQKLGSTSKRKKSSSQSIKNEWKLAKVAFVAIVVYVVSWSPYACVTLIAWAGYARVLTPYSKSVPAVIAKASAIHNPIIYAIIHPSYRKTIRRAIPCLRFLIRISASEVSTSLATSSFRSSMSSRVSFVSKNKSSDISAISATEKTWSDVELDPVETVHTKLQPPENNSFSTNAEEKSELPINAPIEEKFSVSPICPEEPLKRRLKLNAPELLLLTSSLRASSLPFDLNASSRGKSMDTSQAEVHEDPISSQDSLETPILPFSHTPILPHSHSLTSETTLSEEQSLTENIEEENTGLYSAPDKNYLLLKGRLHSSTGPVEKLVS